MVFLRGHRNDYDRWAASGCTGWGFDALLPYFRRLETVTGKDPESSAVTAARCVRRRHRTATRSPRSSSMPPPRPGTRLRTTSTAPPRKASAGHDLSIADGKRQSTAAAYLHPVSARRPNLTVSTDSRAHRLLVEGDRCTGVEFRRGGEPVVAHARAEVILSSGAVDSPRLLLLSGIGPADELRQAGVDVRHGLRGVGRNLHDHPLCGVVYEASRPVPEGLTNHAETSMAWRSDASAQGPDMQLMFIHVPFHPPTLRAPENSFTFGVTTVPESRGARARCSPGTTSRTRRGVPSWRAAPERTTTPWAAARWGWARTPWSPRM
ncbi:GMC family oxidoreductase [Streptomyces sp. NEAU-S77]|uniref:GMC family oxidoreductase n=1 Tax=Streptomyces sp. NEAU-S77 TaxID=3411033 RepID=UPI003BA050B9